MKAEAAKKALRLEMGRKRLALNKAEAFRLDRLAQELLLRSFAWNEARRLGLYMPVNGETGTEMLFAAALASGKKIYLPKVMDAAACSMRFFPCASRQDLHPGRWGIPEPRQSGQEPDSVDLLVMPGLAFDLSGRRLGYGGGYYDRYLCGHPDFAATTIGLCYAFQIMDRVPADSLDRPVSGLCCEEGLLWV